MNVYYVQIRYIDCDAEIIKNVLELFVNTQNVANINSETNCYEHIDKIVFKAPVDSKIFPKIVRKIKKCVNTKYVKLSKPITNFVFITIA